MEYITLLHSDKPFKPTKKIIRDLFKIYNDLVFDGKLSQFRKIYFLSPKADHFGMTHARQSLRGRKVRFSVLGLSSEFPSFMIFVVTLLHEMVHAYQWKFCAMIDHGPTFFDWQKIIEEKLHMPLERNVGEKWAIFTWKTRKPK